MTKSRKVISDKYMRCKICSSKADFFDAVDFTKSCSEHVGFFLPESGEMVEYYRCTACKFIFTAHFDALSSQDFVDKIYNKDYVNFDPLYPEIRPKANAKFLLSIIDQIYQGNAELTILDYGAGNGKFSDFLQVRLNVVNYDPLNPSFNRLPNQTFDLIFSSEVIEHVSFPDKVLADWHTLLKPNGNILFSTMLQPHNITNASWWYISPRNGHISIYNENSLEAICNAHGLEYEALSNEWHLAFHKGQLPAIDTSLLKGIVSDLPTGFIPF